MRLKNGNLSFIYYLINHCLNHNNKAAFILITSNITPYQLSSCSLKLTTNRCPKYMAYLSTDTTTLTLMQVGQLFFIFYIFKCYFRLLEVKYQFGFLEFILFFKNVENILRRLNVFQTAVNKIR